MREIKFRAWFNHASQMINVDAASDYTLTFGNELPRLEMYSQSGEFIEAISGIEVMQYTGLKDKNDREIFEGDILKNEIGENYQVAWNQNGLWGYRRTTDNSSFSQNWWKTEIIGNIYESPELIA